MKHTESFKKNYSEDQFWKKVIRFARKAGSEVIEKALQLYYAAKNPATPTWAKSVIYGALGYFISPIDAIPDFTPVIGYTDDLGILAAALVTVSIYITDDVKAQAAEKMERWFGKNSK